VRVWIQYEKNSTGKSKFIQRLIPALEDLGVKITSKSPDLTLGLQYWKQKPKGRTVIRVDGVHIEKDKKYDWRRHLIKKAIKKSDATIFQSRFAQRMLKGILKVKPKKEFVILNGANPKDYENIEPAKSPFAKNVIISGRYASAKVRPHKRMKDMVRIAKRYTELHPDVGFWICGKLKGDERGTNNVRYTGDLPEAELRRYLVMADVMLCLSFWDWCPNAVVEAVLAQVPVVHNGRSGVGEIVGDTGVAIDIDNDVKPKLQANSPPPVKDELIMHCLDRVFRGTLPSPYGFKPLDGPIQLNIVYTAARYKSAFEEVLK
jgi:glycosyltransferase involved in cell wall biosynthesis